MRKLLILAAAGSLLALAGCSLGANPQKMANDLYEASCGSPEAGVYYKGKKVEPNRQLSAAAIERCRHGGARMTRTTINMDGGGRAASTLANSLR